MKTILYLFLLIFFFPNFVICQTKNPIFITSKNVDVPNIKFIDSKSGVNIRTKVFEQFISITEAFSDTLTIVIPFKNKSKIILDSVPSKYLSSSCVIEVFQNTKANEHCSVITYLWGDLFKIQNRKSDCNKLFNSVNIFFNSTYYYHKTKKILKNRKSNKNFNDLIQSHNKANYQDTLLNNPSDKSNSIKTNLIDTASWAKRNLNNIANIIQLPHKPISWVSDFERIFTEQENLKLDSILNKFEKETTIEIAIVTIDSSVSSREEFDNLILVIANSWGVGKENKNNGIVIGISKSLRKIRIQNGKAIVKRLTDIETKKIINNYFIPEFVTGNYYKGCYNGITEIIKEVRQL